MLELSDYLSLSVSTAEEQWRSILGRREVPAGGRQGDFLPVETLLCFGLGLIGKASRNGNVNVQLTDASVLALARTVKRTPSSLGLKFANLVGSRPNGAKHEQQLWNELTQDLVRFEYLYDIVLRAARRLGIGDSSVPDFLGLEQDTLQAVLDADRVTTEELRDSIDGSLRNLRLSHQGDELVATERALLGMARVGQSQFARRVLDNCGYACVFCGLAFTAAGLPSSRMLIASHIKSWRFSENNERVDPLNGLAACPTHDAAFDAFLFTLSPELRVIPSESLRLAVAADPKVAWNFGPRGISARLLLSEDARHPGPGYLDWHRQRTLESSGLPRGA